MSTYYILQLRVGLKAEKTGRALKNVNYKILFKDGGQQIKEFKGVTDKDGATETLLLERNGELHIFVEGYKNPLIKNKGLMPPLLSKGSNVFTIDNNRLKENLTFVTEAKYNQRKLELESNIKKLKAGQPILNTGVKPTPESQEFIKMAKKQEQYFYPFGKKPQNSFLTHYEDELRNLGKNYNEYKAKNTKRINSDKIYLLFFKSYMLYQLMTSQGKPLQNIKYQIFLERDKKPIMNDNPGAVDAKGMTTYVETPFKNYVKYFVGKEEENSEVFFPVTCVEEPQIRQVVIKTSPATTNPNPNHTVGMASIKNPPIIINPHTNEVLILEPALYAEFDKKTKILAKAVSDVHSSNANLRQKIQARSVEEIEQLEKNLNLNQKKAISKINGEFSQVADIREVWVIESRGQSNNAKPKIEFDRRYLTAKEYEQLNKKRLNTQASVNITSGGSGVSGKAKVENLRRVDAEENIKKSFAKLKESLQVDLAKKKIGNNDNKAIYDLIGGLGGEIVEQYRNSNGTDVSYEAQWMRMVAGSGATGMMSATAKGLKLKADASASVKWTVFEGVKEWKWFHPSKDGWNLQYQNFNLGIIRFLIGTEVSGGIGANLGIAGNLSIDISHASGKQLISATVRDPETSLAKAIDKTKKVKLEPASGTLTDTGENQAKAELKAFAGAQVQGLLKGAIEWYNQYNKDSGGKEAPQFVTIASASAGGGLSAGAGAEGKFRIVYDGRDNKFKFLVAAHLCWGIGAKGIASFEVATDQILNYAGFIKSQLAYAGFKALIFIHEAAFKLISQLLAYSLGNNHPITKAFNNISTVFGGWIELLDIDHGRLNTARNINSHLGKQELIYATPEAKGILLYAVTHWTSSSAAIFDVEYKFSQGEVNFFPERKTAVINILKTCLSAEEWKNTIQHIHPQGSKLTNQQMAKVEGDLVRFLNYSPYGDEKYAADVIEHINQGKVFKDGQNNRWMQDYIKYRDAVKNIKGSLDYMLVKNQDETGFQQILIAHDLKGGLEPEQLYATNLDILAPITEAEENAYLA